MAAATFSERLGVKNMAASMLFISFLRYFFGFQPAEI
jgi:hypothetical protein